MARVKSYSFNEFMSGEYKAKEKKRKQANLKKVQRVGMSAIIPLASGGTIGTLGLISTTTAVFASTEVPGTVVEVGAQEWMGEKTLSALAHVLDPVVDILVALSFPIASVVIVGACFMFMFGNSEKGWTMIQNAGLGYVLIQVSPLILDVLKQVGNAV